MLKSLLLSSTRPFYAPDDEKGVDTRTEAQKQRDSIKVDTSKKTEESDDKKTDDKKEDDKKDDKEGDKEGDDKGEDDNKEGDEEGDEDDDDKVEAQTPEEKEKEIESLKKKVARLEKRTGRTVGERDQLRKDLAAAQAQLNAKVAEGEGLTEEEVERRSDIKANEKAATIEFNKAVQSLVKSAKKVDEKIETKLTEMAEDVAPIPGTMIAILEDLENENGGAVLAHLANNVDVYEDIFSLPMAKLSNRLNKISDRLLEESKKIKKISKVPEPIKTIKGSSESPNVLSDKPNKDADSMEKFVKQRAIQAEQHRKRKLGLAV